MKDMAGWIVAGLVSGVLLVVLGIAWYWIVMIVLVGVILALVAFLMSIDLWH